MLTQGYALLAFWRLLSLGRWYRLRVQRDRQPVDPRNTEALGAMEGTEEGSQWLLSGEQFEGRSDLLNSPDEKLHPVGDSFLFHQLYVVPSVSVSCGCLVVVAVWGNTEEVLGMSLTEYDRSPGTPWQHLYVGDTWRET